MDTTTERLDGIARASSTMPTNGPGVTIGKRLSRCDYFRVQAEPLRGCRNSADKPSQGLYRVLQNRILPGVKADEPVMPVGAQPTCDGIEVKLLLLP